MFHIKRYTKSSQVVLVICKKILMNHLYKRYTKSSQIVLVICKNNLNESSI